MPSGCDIAALKGEGFTQTAIAKRIGVSPSTISRELKRNSDKSGYRGRLATHRTARRRREAKKFIKLDLAMCSMIANLARDYLSPEQMSGRLLRELGVKISHDPMMTASTARSVKRYIGISGAIKKREESSITS